MECECPRFASCRTVLTRCHSLSLTLPDVHYFCNIYRLSMIHAFSRYSPPYKSLAPHDSRVLVVRLRPTNGKWTVSRAEFSVSSSSDVSAVGPKRFVEELHFLLVVSSPKVFP